MIDLPIGKAIVTVEVNTEACDNCIFDRDNFCGLPSPNTYCGNNRRQDGKNVIFKIVDLPEMKKSLEHFNDPPSADILNNL